MTSLLFTPSYFAGPSLAWKSRYFCYGARLGEANVSTSHVRLRCYLRRLYFSFCLCARARTQFIPEALRLRTWPRSRIRHRFSAASVSAARPQTVSAAGGCNIKYLAISGRMLPLSTVARAPPPPLPRSIARVEYSRPRARCIRTRDTHRCLMRASRPASVRVATPECVT